MGRPIIVLVTTGTEQQALTIAEELIQQELVACVNILPTVRSIYRFKGKILDDEENLLVIKTTDDRYDEVAQVITQLHTYEIPEIMALEVIHTQTNVRDWILDAVKRKN